MCVCVCVCVCVCECVCIGVENFILSTVYIIVTLYLCVNILVRN